jgi:hypothetical protein
MEKIRKEARKKVIGDSLDVQSKAPQTKHLPREFSRPSAARELIRCAAPTAAAVAHSISEEIEYSADNRNHPY